MKQSPHTPHDPAPIRAANRDPFAHLLDVHEQMRALAPADAGRPALHMSPQAGRTYAFDAAIIFAHPRKET
jgi:hypothetical protein